MNQEQEKEKERLEELNLILTAISIDSEETINEATEIIQNWINNTIGVKGYCRTQIVCI